MATITVEKIELDEEYISSKSGILNALTYASAEYIYKVLERHSYKEIKWFDKDKQRKLHRTIIHKNAHLDEYFAELLFRSILPRHLKDIEVYEHILMSKEQDAYARISFPNAVVFGIRSDETGGAKALQFFDEHNKDGTRISPSCSQLVAETFIGKRIPNSIAKVLEDVNYSDSYKGAHSYHIKNILFHINEIFLLVGKDENSGDNVRKMLTENWKRAIINVCIVSFIYAFENGKLRGFPKDWNNNFKTKVEITTKGSFNRFIERTYLKDDYSSFNLIVNHFSPHFKVWKEEESKNDNFHNTINGSSWKDKKTNQEIKDQTLLFQPLCYALYECWGRNIADFIMCHLWQSIFQAQISFDIIKNGITSIPNFKKINGISSINETCFGSISRLDFEISNIKPGKSESDETNRHLENIKYFPIYSAKVTNQSYLNVQKVLLKLLNERNEGFGLIYIENKLINSKIINRGPTFPKDKWIVLSDRITSLEPECWFQLQPDGEYADFLLNRTEAHQDQLPSTHVDIEFLKQCLIDI